MQLIKEISSSITPLRAVDCHKNGAQIAYFIANGNPHILVCLSCGELRDSQSCKPTEHLYGFIELHRPNHEPRYVRKTKLESIVAASDGASGYTLALFESLTEVLAHI